MQIQISNWEHFIINDALRKLSEEMHQSMIDSQELELKTHYATAFVQIENLRTKFRMIAPVQKPTDKLKIKTYDNAH